MRGNNKIDFLYSFHFDDRNEKAIKRLRTSIKSIIDQPANVCVSDTSNISIWDDIKDLGDIRYIHKATNKPYCKPLTINFGVKNLVSTVYFFHSDIDLVYQKGHIERMVEYTKRVYLPVRVVNYNYNVSYECFSPNYYDQMKLPGVFDPAARPWGGLAHGNGLIHLVSFHQVQGYDEDFIGYGPEDDMFNKRIAYINDLIYLDEEKPDYTKTATAHIFHTRTTGAADEVNRKLYREKLDRIQAIDVKDLTKEDLKANKHQDNWGVI